MSWLLIEKLLRHQQSVRSSEGCCVDRLNSPREKPTSAGPAQNYVNDPWRRFANANYPRRQVCSIASSGANGLQISSAIL